MTEPKDEATGKSTLRLVAEKYADRELSGMQINDRYRRIRIVLIGGFMAGALWEKQRWQAEMVKQEDLDNAD